MAVGLVGVVFVLLAPGVSARAADKARRDSGVAAADSLDGVIDRLIAHERFVAALGVAANQLQMRMQTQGPRDRATLASIQRIARITHLGGDQDTAERVCNLALALREAELGPHHADVAETLALKAMIAKYAEQFDVAMECIEQGLAITEAQQTPDSEVVASLLQARANIMRRRGVESGVPDYAEAYRVRRAAGRAPTLPLADSATWLAWATMQLGRHEEALHYFDEAETYLNEMHLDQHSLMGVILAARAEALAVHNRWEEADSLYGIAMPIFEKAQRGYFPGFSRRKLPMNASEVHALVLLKLKRWEDAWFAKQKFSNDIQMDFLVLSNWKNVDAEGYEDVRRLRRKLLDVRAVLGESSAPGDRVDAAGVTEQYLETFAEKIKLTAEMFQREQAYLDDHVPSEVAVADVQRYLSPNTALLGMVDTRIADYGKASRGAVLYSTWAYIVRDTGPIEWIPIMENRTAREHSARIAPVHRLAEMLWFHSEWPTRVERDEDIRVYARQAAELLFDPLLERLHGANVLVIEFTHMLEGLSVESLMDPSGEYMSDRFAITYTPSSGAYVQMQRMKGKPRDYHSVLAIGGAVFNDADQAPGDSRLGPAMLRAVSSRRPEALDRLPRLPFSEYEVRAVSAMFDTAAVLDGEQASEVNLNRLATSGDLGRYDVVHIATHSLIDHFPERCAFALSRANVTRCRDNDGLIETDELLLGWNLHAQVVTLSGCQSARTMPGDGRYLGLATALIGVGVQSLVGSMWKVDDEATALLMTRFYSNLTGERGSRPMSKAKALAEARRWVREYQDEDGNRPFRHPIYWAAFVLVGLPD